MARTEHPPTLSGLSQPSVDLARRDRQTRPMKVFVLLALSTLSGAASAAQGQRFEFSPATTEDAALDLALPELARQAMAVYQDSNQAAYLGNLFRLQMMAGDPA